MAGLKDTAVYTFTGVDVTGFDASGGGSSKALPNTPCVINKIWTRQGSGTDADPYKFWYYGDTDVPEIADVAIDWNGIDAEHATLPGEARVSPGLLIANALTVNNKTGFAIFIETLHNG